MYSYGVKCSKASIEKVKQPNWDLNKYFINLVSKKILRLVSIKDSPIQETNMTMYT